MKSLSGKRILGPLFLLLLLVSCGKRRVGQVNVESVLTVAPAQAPNVEKAHRPLSPFSLDEALIELKGLQTPQGVDCSLFTRLKSGLEAALTLKPRRVERSSYGSPGQTLEEEVPFFSSPEELTNWMGRLSLKSLSPWDTAQHLILSKLPKGSVLAPSQSGLSWNEVREGDYNNDGIVKADDIVPIAIHFGKSDDPGSPSYYKYAEYIDGDGDGVIGIGDVAAIADHFGESTIGYNIYEALDSAGTGMGKVATILRPSPPQDPDNPPYNISFATLEYDTSQGVIEVESAATKQEQVTRSGTGVPPVNDLGHPAQATAQLGRDDHATHNLDHQVQSTTVPPGWVPTPGKFYSVVPYGQGFDEQGEPIFVERFNLASNWVYINIPPVAIFEASPVSGEAPVTVTFDARDSYDADGYITNYFWDFDGDGLTDRVTQTPITTYEFTGPSVKPATLIIYDNTGEASPPTDLSLRVSGFLTEVVESGILYGAIDLQLRYLSGDPVVTYVEGDFSTLRYAFQGQDGWRSEVVYSVPAYQYLSSPLLFLDSSEIPNVVYRITSLNGPGRVPLYWAKRKQGGNWEQAMIASGTESVSTALAFGEGCALVGVKRTLDVNPHPTVYLFEGGLWKKEIVDPIRYSYSVDAAFLDPEENLVVYYIDESLPQNHMLATRRNGLWDYEVLGPDGIGLWTRLEHSFAYSKEGTLTIAQLTSLPPLLGFRRGDTWDVWELEFLAGIVVGGFKIMYDCTGRLWLIFVRNTGPGEESPLGLLTLSDGKWYEVTPGIPGVYRHNWALSTEGSLGVVFNQKQRLSEYVNLYYAKRIDY